LAAPSPSADRRLASALPMTALINKTMSRDDLASPQARRIVRELDELVRRLEAMGLPPSTWYGELETGSRHRSWERINRGPDYEPLTEAADDDRYPWFLYWEIAWLTLHNEYRAGQRLLDLGGAGSLFACYVASLGVEVTAIDLNEELVKQGSLIAERTGWPLSNLAIDMQEPHVSGPFDHATSVCVFEHLPLSGRVQVSRGVPELLVPGGSFSVTFDYLNPAPTAMISSPAAVHAQFARASGLGLRGNQRFHDTGERYLLHPGGPDSGRYTFGALFMEKR
jgi:hypothetical protein